jgi:hypothetical protein
MPHEAEVLVELWLRISIRYGPTTLGYQPPAPDSISAQLVCMTN